MQRVLLQHNGRPIVLDEKDLRVYVNTDLKPSTQCTSVQPARNRCRRSV